ncbi:hypothetical protein [Methylobacterium sp. ID0610]|uniref:hypothetical protein n=1 Tax=Methylobacterium carpenticola TaxID=3344827 RepID=UPI0036A439DF
MAGRQELELLLGDGETLVRDGYRGARLLLRTGTRLLPDGVPLARGVSRLARRVDETITRAETIALSVLRPHAGREGLAELLHALTTCAADRAEFARVFVEVQYLLIESVLRHWGAKNVYISEHLIRLALRTVEARHASLVTRLRDGREPDPALIGTFATAAALALIGRQPILYVSAEDGPTQRPITAESCNVPCFLAAALALTGYAREPSSDLAPYVMAAADIIDARHERFTDLCRRPEALSLLDAEFSSIASAMP